MSEWKLEVGDKFLWNQKTARLNKLHTDILYTIEAREEHSINRKAIYRLSWNSPGEGKIVRYSMPKDTVENCAVVITGELAEILYG